MAVTLISARVLHAQAISFSPSSTQLRYFSNVSASSRHDQPFPPFTSQEDKPPSSGSALPPPNATWHRWFRFSSERRRYSRWLHRLNGLRRAGQNRESLGSEQETAVVALMIKFGCFCCWELASALKEAKPIFDSASVTIIAVGIGSPEKARVLANRAYDTLGLYKGFGWTFFNPATVKVFSRVDKVFKAMKKYTIKAIPEDPSSMLQQGEMFVFKVRNCYTEGKRRAQEIMPRSTTSSMSVVKLRSLDTQNGKQNAR